MLALLKASESDILHAHSPDARQLHERALNAADQFRRSEAQLIDALMAVDQEKVFLHMGYPSLFKYAVEALRLTEATAYNFILVARKSREVPALQATISAGELSVSKAKKIVAVLTPENQNDWLEKAQMLSSRQLEKEVASENPRLATRESATYVSGKRLELTLGLEEPLMLKLRRAQDLVSQSKNRPATLEETLETLADFYLKQKDPVDRAKRVIAKKGLSPQLNAPDSRPAPSNKASQKLVTGPVETDSKSSSPKPAQPTHHPRTPIPAHIAHQVRLRDQGQCQFKIPTLHPQRGAPEPYPDQATGSRICGSRRWTDLHHIQPLSQGGKHTLGNLTTFCRAHHRHTHSKLTR